MESIGWRFPPLSGGNKQCFNSNDIEAFKGEELMDNLAREICQNSLDAKKRGSNDPVRVVFELRYIEAERYPLFAQYGDCIKRLRAYYQDNMNPQLEQFLDDADLMLDQKEMPVMVIGDYNTRGLDGSRTHGLKSKWEALTSSDGLSADKEGGSGGSYGIGKNAPFACSAIRMVFYNTLADDGDSAFMGVGRLATFINEDGEETQRVGRYQVNDDENRNWYPIYPETEDSFRDLFCRDEEGTDVIIAGFGQEDNWESELSKAILKNFFVAISEGTLVAEIKNANGGRIINAETLGKEIEGFEDDRDMIETLRLYEALKNPDSTEYLSILSDQDVEVRIAARPNFGRRIAHFRNIGMLVNYTYRRIMQHYAAVVIVKGEDLSELLRKTEPARHNRWDHKLITGKTAEAEEQRKMAKKAIRDLNNGVLELLKRQFEVAPADEVDAVGVSEYLPDNGEPGAMDVAGDDALRPIIKLGKVKVKPRKQDAKAIIEQEGKKATGSVEEGEVGNHTVHPTPDPPSVTPVVVPGGEGEQKQGVTPGKGAKTIRNTTILRKRTVAVSERTGLYKTILTIGQDCERQYISFAALGEDGRSIPLTLKSLTLNGSGVPVQGAFAGPVSFRAGEPSVIFANFDKREKMRVDISITKEAK